MKITRIQKGLVLSTITAAMLVAGCELIVDFDRTTIPPETADAGGPDVNAPDTGAPAEAGTEDAGDTSDASDDAGDAAS